MEVDVVITKLNETYMKVDCKEVHIEYEIADRFSFKVDNAKFDPRVRAGRWDGIKRLYNRKYHRMYCGLLIELVKFLNKQRYSYHIDPDLISQSSISKEEISEIINEVIKPHNNGEPIVPHDFQLNMSHYMLNMGRSISLASTSAGKSLVLYMVARIYQLLEEFEEKRIVIIVPSKMLVEQLFEDFRNYSSYEGSNWDVDRHCQKINGDYTKTISRQIIISTWHSLTDIPKWVLSDAGAIFVDEVHTVRGQELTKLLENAVGCPIRHGLTGTLDGMECNELAAQGLLGPAKTFVTAKESINRGIATKIKIYCVIIDYDNDTKRRYHADQMNVPQSRPGLKYQSEINFINNLQCRFDYLQKLISSLKGNTIVLFDRVEAYGLPLYEDMKSKHENTFLISGGVDGKEREEIRTSLEGFTDAKLYATSQIMSTGVSIKNLHNMVYESSTKSKVKILQSIGRLMRLHESKEAANFFDVTDKLDYNGVPNYRLKHLEERVKYYVSEGHPVEFITVKLVEEANNTLF